MTSGIYTPADGIGEPTDKWAFREPGFFGSMKQLTCCARCGPHPARAGQDHHSQSVRLVQAHASFLVRRVLRPTSRLRSQHD
jgi:hypothetical protein